VQGAVVPLTVPMEQKGGASTAGGPEEKDGPDRLFLQHRDRTTRALAAGSLDGPRALVHHSGIHPSRSALRPAHDHATGFGGYSTRALALEADRAIAQLLSGAIPRHAARQCHGGLALR
jgi:hypothetical protein